MPVQSLGSPEAFRLVYRQGRRLAHETMVLYARPNGLPVLRASVSVAKGTGNATRRNRVRRRIGEAMRLETQRAAGGFDLVLVPRAPAADAPFAALQDALHALLVQAGVVRPSGEDS